MFDALSTDRPYKTAWTPEAAFEEIRRLKSEKFDPAVVDAFFDCESEVRAIFSDAGEGPWTRYRLPSGATLI